MCPTDGLLRARTRASGPGLPAIATKLRASLKLGIGASLGLLDAEIKARTDVLLFSERRSILAYSLVF